MSVSALGRLKNHNVPHLHPDFRIFMPVSRLPLKIQGDFFNWASPENVSRLAPPKFAWSGPP